MRQSSRRTFFRSERKQKLQGAAKRIDDRREVRYQNA
jgi:hypothetical protein